MTDKLSLPCCAGLWKLQILWISCVLQEVSAGPAGSLPADLAILATAADQLFESTSRMSTDAVESMLTALQSISNASIPAAAAQPGAPK